MKKERPDVLRGSTRKTKTGCGSLYVTINEDSEGHTIEVFCKLGKTGGCGASQLEAIGRLISISLRSGYDIHDIIKQLKGISCHQPIGLGPMKVASCSDGVAQILMAYLDDKEEKSAEEKTTAKEEKGAKEKTTTDQKDSNYVADLKLSTGLPSKR